MQENLKKAARRLMFLIKNSAARSLLGLIDNVYNSSLPTK
jgi:hypothetical protein